MGTLAFIGLGNMGSGMCANLVRAGHRVQAFDLNQAAVQTAAEAGATGCTSLAETVRDAETIVTMLPAGKHVLDVYFGQPGLVELASPSALLIDCSTISVDEARQAAHRAEQAGFILVDAPVSGGVAAARAGTLTFMVGGPASGFDQARPILSAMGRTMVHAGPSGNGQAAKIANNMLLGISMIATCEAFTLAEKLGLDAQTFFDIASQASGQNWSMTSYCPAPGPVPAAPSNHEYEAGFTTDMMLKDLRLAQQAAQSVALTTHFGAAAMQHYEQLVRTDQGHLDFSVIMRLINGTLTLLGETDDR